MSNPAENLSNVKAVIFDYGDVLCTRPTAAEIEASARILDVPIDQFNALWGRHRDRFDRGDLSSDAYWIQFAEDAGRSLTALQLRDLAQKDVAMWSSLNPAMIAWLDDLSKAGMKTAVLSNMHADMAEHARQNFKWLSGLTFVTLSAEVRLIKPAREIYELTLKGLKVASPEEALFIDDREVNVKGAREMGLHAVVFKSIEQLRQDLATAGFPYLPRLETSEVSARAN
jgi:putative hydrolase of the HAD superfamily